MVVRFSTLSRMRRQARSRSARMKLKERGDSISDMTNKCNSKDLILLEE